MNSVDFSENDDMGSMPPMMMPNEYPYPPPHPFDSSMMPMRPPFHPEMHSTGGLRHPHHWHGRGRGGRFDGMHHQGRHGPRGGPYHFFGHPMRPCGPGGFRHEGKPILTYFDVPGLAEAIRMTFHIGGVMFEDRRISKDEWLARYKNYSPTKQCPILEVDGRVIVQSQAILQYAASRSQMLPRADESVLAAHTILGKIGDLRAALKHLYYMSESDEKQTAMKEASEKQVMPYMSYLEGFIAQHQADPTMHYALGDCMTYVDVVIADFVRQLQERDFTVDMSNYPKLTAIQQLVMDHPAIVAYLKSRKQLRPKLYYANAPGIAQPIRWAFTIGEIEFDDIHITMEDLKARQVDQPTLRMPLLEVNGKQYTESMGMLHYAALKTGLVPCCQLDRAHAWSVTRMGEQIVVDFMLQYRKVVDHADVQKLMTTWVSETMIDSLEKLETLVKMYQDAEGHVVGSKLSFADLSVANLHLLLRGDKMGRFMNLNNHQYPQMKRVYDMVMNIEAVRQYEYSFHKTTPILTTFEDPDCSGAVQMLFKLGRIDFEDRRITRETFEQSYKKTSPNGMVPLLEVDGQPICETKAILTYVAERAQLLPPTYLGRARAEMIYQTWDPIFVYVRDHLWCLPQGPERQKAMIEIRDTKMQGLLGAYEAILAPKQHSIGYLVDNQLTWVDVMVAAEFRKLVQDGLINEPASFPVLSKVLEIVEKAMKQL